MVDLNGKLRLHGRFQYEAAHIGAERSPIVVIDNFLSDPGIVIDYAAEHCAFESVSDAFYPGSRAPAPPIYGFAVRAFLGKLIGDLFGFGGSEIASEVCNLSIVTTPPDKLSGLQRIPHFDKTYPKQIALLHYLCSAEHGGTSFYRHRLTGHEFVDGARFANYRNLVLDELAARGPPPDRYIGGDDPMFERIASYDAAFNRVLVYRSMNLHSASIPPGFNFDPDPRTGRLTANTFLTYR